MPADTPNVERDIQSYISDNYWECTNIFTIKGSAYDEDNLPPLTVNDATCIMECLLFSPNPFEIFEIKCYDIHNPAILDIFRDGLLSCPHITNVILDTVNLSNEDLDHLRLAFYNTSVRILSLNGKHIRGRRGGEVLRDLLVDNETLRELILSYNLHFGGSGQDHDWYGDGDDGPEVAIGLGQGLADNHGLQILNLEECKIGNDFLANLLLPAHGKINNSLLELNLENNSIQGEDGVRQVSLLLQRFSALKVLKLGRNRNLGGAGALAPGLAAARHLEELDLDYCYLGNDGLANLLPGDGTINNTLTNLNLCNNDIRGAEGGRQVSLLLQHFPALNVLLLNDNYHLGPLGAHAMAPGLAAASHLETLWLNGCHIGNDGMASLVPDGQVNRSLTHLFLHGNDIQGLVGGENIIALASRCTSLDTRYCDKSILSSDQQRRLDLLCARKCLVTEASALGGSTFPILFRFVEEAHSHEHGLSAIFVILQNDGDDYFCTALNRAIE